MTNPLGQLILFGVGMLAACLAVFITNRILKW
jgi:hypothetical protein